MNMWSLLKASWSILLFILTETISGFHGFTTSWSGLYIIIIKTANKGVTSYSSKDIVWAQITVIKNDLKDVPGGFVFRLRFCAVIEVSLSLCRQRGAKMLLTLLPFFSWVDKRGQSLKWPWLWQIGTQGVHVISCFHFRWQLSLVLFGQQVWCCE